ncbi:hypothetical protein F5Y05DRAFT_386363 [Hypoxylon sp. FL0543]|nr:hypothetical protein F5Y05DRAFT_386363 [Hypoxylon sp. FL0543]
MSNDDFAMGPFPNEVVLAIVEQMDTRSMCRLMETSKTLCKLIRDNERSISKRQFAKYGTPVGNVLSSDLFFRRRLNYGTFKAVKEMEMREARIDDVLRNSGYINLAAPIHLGPLDVVKQERLYLLLKQALKHCDNIADIAANPPCAQMIQPSYRRFEVGHFRRYNVPYGFQLQDPVTKHRTRQLHVEYIQNLPAEDFAMVIYLLSALESGYSQIMSHLANFDPTFPERVVVVKECVLRHGSWYAWGLACGDNHWRIMTDAISQVGMVELIKFEFGLETEETEEELKEPNLHSGLWNRFKSLFPTDGTGYARLYQLVGRLVNGSGDEDEGGDGEKAGEEETEEQAEEEAKKEVREESKGEDRGEGRESVAALV